MQNGMKFAFIGVARNVAESIDKSIRAIQKSFGFTNEQRWIVCESDSDDETIKALEKIKNNIAGFSYTSLGRLSDSIPKRSERIAFCRNECLRQLRAMEGYNNLDYIVMADLDGINDGLTEDSVLSCWKHSGWDACFANQVGAYYDIWALRHPIWCPGDCWSAAKFLNEMGLDYSHSIFSAVASKMIEIPKNYKLIEVQSAFGGIGIFRRNIIDGALTFTGVDTDGEEMCEWVNFNTALHKNGAKLFINPGLINGGWNEHTSAFKDLLIKIRSLAN